MSISELITLTREIIVLFEKVELRPWGIETMMNELTGEVGTLADTIMITEGYRQARPTDTPDLQDDIADILFMLIRIADHYHIDLEAAYRQMIAETRGKLQQRIEQLGERQEPQS
jgi:NTP pyrophosphatase (non-canonical NTP hydrolase)